MHPILFEIPRIEFGDWTLGPIPIRLYGLMIGIGFLVSIWLASRQAKKEGIDPEPWDVPRHEVFRQLVQDQHRGGNDRDPGVFIFHRSPNPRDAEKNALHRRRRRHTR